MAKLISKLLLGAAAGAAYLAYVNRSKIEETLEDEKVVHLLNNVKGTSTKIINTVGDQLKELKDNVVDKIEEVDIDATVNEITTKVIAGVKLVNQQANEVFGDKRFQQIISLQRPKEVVRVLNPHIVGASRKTDNSEESIINMYELNIGEPEIEVATETVEYSDVLTNESNITSDESEVSAKQVVEFVEVSDEIESLETDVKEVVVRGEEEIANEIDQQGLEVTNHPIVINEMPIVPNLEDVEIIPVIDVGLTNASINDFPTSDMPVTLVNTAIIEAAIKINPTLIDEVPLTAASIPFVEAVIEPFEVIAEAIDNNDNLQVIVEESATNPVDVESMVDTENIKPVSITTNAVIDKGPRDKKYYAKFLKKYPAIDIDMIFTVVEQIEKMSENLSGVSRFRLVQSVYSANANKQKRLKSDLKSGYVITDRVPESIIEVAKVVIMELDVVLDTILDVVDCALYHSMQYRGWRVELLDN